MDLIASTGVNDQSSPWYAGFLQTALSTASDAGARALNNALGAQTPITGVQNTTGAPAAAAAPVSVAAAAPAGSNNTMLLILAAIVLAVMLVLFSRK